jgi:hypothetical protein
MLKRNSIAELIGVVILLVMTIIVHSAFFNNENAFAKAVKVNNSTKTQKKQIFSYESIDENLKKKINNISYKDNKYIKISDLADAKVTYYGFDDKTHAGELIVNKKVAKDVIEIFKELYKAKFPIEKIRLIDDYNADDDLSMSDNNTSAFCYRTVANTNKISMHGYGMAIDINPIQNPCISGKDVSPQNAYSYLNRNLRKKGMIIKNDVCYKAFTKRGWKWGGNWKNPKDYQHFEIDKR